MSRYGVGLTFLFLLICPAILSGSERSLFELEKERLRQSPSSTTDVPQLVWDEPQTFQPAVREEGRKSSSLFSETNVSPVYSSSIFHQESASSDRFHEARGGQSSLFDDRHQRQPSSIQDILSQPARRGPEQESWPPVVITASDGSTTGDEHEPDPYSHAVEQRYAIPDDYKPYPPYDDEGSQHRVRSYHEKDRRQGHQSRNRPKFKGVEIGAEPGGAGEAIIHLTVNQVRSKTRDDEQEEDERESDDSLPYEVREILSQLPPSLLGGAKFKPPPSTTLAPPPAPRPVQAAPPAIQFPPGQLIQIPNTPSTPVGTQYVLVPVNSPNQFPQLAPPSPPATPPVPTTTTTPRPLPPPKPQVIIISPADQDHYDDDSIRIGGHRLKLPSPPSISHHHLNQADRRRDTTSYNPQTSSSDHVTHVKYPSKRIRIKVPSSVLTKAAQKGQDLLAQATLKGPTVVVYSGGSRGERTPNNVIPLDDSSGKTFTFTKKGEDGTPLHYHFHIDTDGRPSQNASLLSPPDSLLAPQPPGGPPGTVGPPGSPPGTPSSTTPSPSVFQPTGTSPPVTAPPTTGNTGYYQQQQQLAPSIQFAPLIGQQQRPIVIVPSTFPSFQAPTFQAPPQQMQQFGGYGHNQHHGYGKKKRKLSPPPTQAAPPPPPMRLPAVLTIEGPIGPAPPPQPYHVHHLPPKVQKEKKKKKRRRPWFG